MPEITSRVHVDPADRRYTFIREQDVEPILDRNHVLRGIPQKSDWGRHVASIPCVIIEKWLNEEYERGNVTLRPFTKEFDELVTRKLQDPDWRYLRVDK